MRTAHITKLNSVLVCTALLGFAACDDSAKVMSPEQSPRLSESAETVNRAGEEGVVKGSHNTTLQITDLNTATPNDLATALAGTGVTITSVSYTGDNIAGGLYSDGSPLGLTGDGVILSSGNATNVHGPNISDAITANLGLPGDADLTALSGFTTFDATTLAIDFEVGAGADQIFIEYVFGSDEYNEWVNTTFNDVFAFFVNGVNCAVVGAADDPVTINNINTGSNSAFYNNNDPSDTATPFDTEADGFTDVLVCQADVNPGSNTVELKIADAGDPLLDSWVLLKGASFSTVPPVEVDIDIKPGSFPNSINLRNKQGVIPVALLGSADFDVSDVDVTSLEFGDLGEGEFATPAHDLTDPIVLADHMEDVNADGWMDLVSHYLTQDTGIDFDDTEACLRGETDDPFLPLPFQGCDSVRPIGG